MEFAAYVTRRVDISDLFVEPPTFGMAHRLPTELGWIEVALPLPPEAYAFREGRANDRDALRDNWFEPGQIGMKLDLIEPIQFEGSEDQFNSSAVRTTSTIASLDPVLTEAFERWKRTLRWTGLAPMIDVGEVEYRSSRINGLGFRIVRASDHKLFYGFGGSTSSTGGCKVSVEAWNAAERLLLEGVHPPVWFDYLFEAVRKNWVGDFHAGVVAAALACEALIRAAFDASLPPIDNPVGRYIISNANVQALLQRWPELSGQSKVEANANGKSAVHRLFDLRNELMHARLGDFGRLREIDELLPDIARFIMAGDVSIRNIQNLPNVIYPAPRALENLTRPRRS